MNNSRMKRMCIAFYFGAKVLIHKELSAEQIVIGQIYADGLHHLKDRARLIHPDRRYDWIILYNYAPSRTLLATAKVLAICILAILPQALFVLDLTLKDILCSPESRQAEMVANREDYSDPGGFNGVSQ